VSSSSRSTLCRETNEGQVTLRRRSRAAKVQPSDFKAASPARFALTAQQARAICAPRWHSPLGSANKSGPRPDGGEETLLSILTEDSNMAKTKFRPLHDRVVVRRVESEEKTKGGIIIPDTAKEKPQEGEIIAVGSGARDEAGKLVPLDVKTGDRILFGKWSGTEVKLNGEDLLIMKESDIMGIIG
jgi:chaperonin GroES